MTGTTAIAETVLTMLGTSGITYFFTRRMYKKQVEAAHLANEQTAVDIWKTLALDLKAELTETRTELKQVRKELDELKSQWKTEHHSGK